MSQVTPPNSTIPSLDPDDIDLGELTVSEEMIRQASDELYLDQVEFSPIPIHKVNVTCRDGGCHNGETFHLHQFQQFADIIPVCRGVNYTDRYSGTQFTLSQCFRYQRVGLANSLVNVPNLEREHWGDRYHSTLKNYMDYWIAHTLEMHRDECRGGEQGLSADYDYFSDTNSTEYVKSYTFRGQKWVTINMGLTLNLEHNLKPVYAFFCEPTDDEKRTFGWLDAEGREKYIYPGVNWNPRFILKGFRTRRTASNQRFERDALPIPRDFPKAAPFEGSEEQYDPRIVLFWDHDHIINREINKNRIKAVYSNAQRDVPSDSELSRALKDAVEMTITMATRDLGLARMHCYRDGRLNKEKLQFLLPLYLLRNPNTYDLALAVDLRQVIQNDDALRADREGRYNPANYTYRASTVLQPEWAYMNSRLLGRVRQAWLLQRPATPPQPRVPQPRVPHPRVPQSRVPQPRVPQPRVPQPRVPQPRVPQPPFEDPFPGRHPRWKLQKCRFAEQGRCHNQDSPENCSYWHTTDERDQAQRRSALVGTRSNHVDSHRR